MNLTVEFQSITKTLNAEMESQDKTLLPELSDLMYYPVPGPQGPPGEGMPAGGTTGQVLAKASDQDYDLMWKDPITYLEVSNEFGGKTVTIGGV